MKVILASASERRQELLGRVVKDFEITVSDFDEDMVKYQGNVSEYVKEIALGKAQDVAKKITEDVIIIAADTIVTLNDTILGKPKDDSEAFRMLKSLSGNSHKVYSGVVLINTATGKTLKSSLATEVKFSKLTDEEITDYIKSGEPLDKAGAYGIQGQGGVFVEEIRGCYYNVVGLPLNRLKYMINEII
ncbi:Maf-like protein [Clostridium paraputrificum]|uniref:Maf-like protein n=1 Tax=Clostridium paraputrificum TaxID=29363 RepID=UPI003D3354E0